MSSPDKKKSFVLYASYLEAVQSLPLDVRGELFTMILLYENGMEPETDSDAARSAFLFIKPQLDRDRAEYEKKCAKNKEIAQNREAAKREKLSEINKEYRAEKSTDVHERTHNDNDDDNEYDYISILSESSDGDDPYLKKIPVKEAFERIYKAYPRKEGKSKGMEYVIAYLKKGRQIAGMGTVRFNHEELYCAVRNYSFTCEENGTEPQYMQLFSTFMNKSVIDYAEKAKQDGYDEYMKEKYGDDWEHIRFKYE